MSRTLDLGVPNIASISLLTRSPVAVRPLVHFTVFRFLFETTTLRIDQILHCVWNDLVGNSEGDTLGVIRPFVISLVALSKWFSDVRVIGLLFGLEKLQGKSSKLISFQ